MPLLTPPDAEHRAASAQDRDDYATEIGRISDRLRDDMRDLAALLVGHGRQSTAAEDTAMFAVIRAHRLVEALMPGDEQ